MGSLVPGWDETPGLVPKGLQEFDETDEGPKGYFAKLQSMRSMRHSEDSAATGTAAATAAAVTAAGTCYHPVATGGLRHVELPGGGAKLTPGDAHSKMNKCQSERVPDLSRYSMDKNKSTGPVLGRLSSRASVPATDWEQELDSLRGDRPLGRTSLGRTSTDNDPHHLEADHHQEGWWARMDHGALNAPVEVEDSEAAREVARKSSFVPQFNVTGTHLH